MTQELPFPTGNRSGIWYDRKSTSADLGTVGGRILMLPFFVT